MKHPLLTTLLVPLAMLQAQPAATPQPATPLALPTPQQVAWHDMDLEMFIHISPATWQDVQHDNLSTPLSAIDPKELDTDQWAEVAVSMGAKQIVFVAKHDGGFCWWQTDTTDYSVRKTPWRGGQGDVLKDLAKSCQSHGLKLGVYLSPADRKLGVGVGGRAKTPAEQENYNRLYRQQLTEVLSRYGTISEVWFDGSNIVPVADLLQQYAPQAMVFQSPQTTVSWIGNEEGTVRYPTWNALPAAKARSGTSTGYDSDPDGDAWLPNECDARIRADWFWSTTNAATLKSVDQLMGMYYRSVGLGAVLLLNHTPDTTGRIPAADARRAAEFGAEIARRFGTSLAATAGRGAVVELDLGRPTRIDHVISAENILEGERVREYLIEGLVNGQWQQLCEGTAIGHKKIDQFAPVTAAKIRLRCVRAAAEPRIRQLAAYSVWGDNPPPAQAAELQAVTRTLWNWSQDNVPEQATRVKLDLTPYCRDAGVYVVNFARTGGKDLEVQAVTLIAQGHQLDTGVHRKTVRGTTQYHLTLTEEGVKHELEIMVRLPDAASRGQATIQRLVH